MGLWLFYCVFQENKRVIFFYLKFLIFDRLISDHSFWEVNGWVDLQYQRMAGYICSKDKIQRVQELRGRCVVYMFECKAKKKKKQTSLTYLGNRNVLGLNYYYHYRYYNVRMSVCLWMHTWHGVVVEVRGQSSGVSSLFSRRVRGLEPRSSGLWNKHPYHRAISLARYCS